jgi:hypothetical protein
MNLTAARPSIRKTISAPRVRSGTVYALIIILAMISFEVFNYSTTAFSLKDLLGNLKFAGIPWSTFLALAFCGIDFAGIARLITPENRNTGLKESWYLFGAWLIAATANAALTWWGVAVAISGHTLQSTAVIDLSTLTRVVPVFVAILVWVLRILIIASLSSALERLFSKDKSHDYGSESAAVGFKQYAAPKTSNQRPAASPITMTRMSNSTRSNHTSPTYFDFASFENSSQEEKSESKSRLF